MRSLKSLWWTAARVRSAQTLAVASVLALGGVSTAGAQVPAEPVNIFTHIGITAENTKANVELRGGWSLPAEEMPPSRQIVTPAGDAADDVRLRMPNTSGTVDNLAQFNGQTIVLREQEQGNYPRLHFFGTTTDGGPAGGDFLLRFSDGTQQTVNIRFPDWCNMGSAGVWHPAIGPLSHRHTPTGQDGAPCGIFHVPADTDGTKTLVSVTLPPTTVGGGGNTRTYLMALTLEDAAGNFVTPDLGASPFPDDLKPPTSSHQLAPAEPDGDNGWYTREVQVTLAGADEDDGAIDASGLERMEYRVDGGAFQPYAQPFTVSGDGRHTVEYRAVDRAGNTEVAHQVPVGIDGTPPATLGSLDPARPGADGWYDRPVALELLGRDGGGSGATAFEYRVGGGSFAPYTAPVMFDAPGVYDVSFRSTDAAGNTGGASSLSFRVDAEAPTTSATLNGAAPAQNYATGPVTVALGAADRGSGAASTQFAVDGRSWQPYTQPFGVSGNGVHVVAFRSTDAAGNVENAKEVVFRIGPVQMGEGVVPVFPPAAPAPADDAWVGIVTPAENRATVNRLRRGKLSVDVRCRSVEGGVLRLRVSRRTARQLGLTGRTLAREAFTCEDDGRLTVRFHPSRKVRRALRETSRRLPVMLIAQAGTAEDRQAIQLRGERRG